MTALVCEKYSRHGGCELSSARLGAEAVTRGGVLRSYADSHSRSHAVGFDGGGLFCW